MTGNSKRVLILEAGADGHHPYYVRLLLDSGLAEFSQIIVAAQAKMFNHPAIAGCAVPFLPHPIELPPRFRVPAKRGAAEVVVRSLIFGNIYKRAYRDLLASGPIDFVIVPYVDDCLLGLGAPSKPFGNAPWLAITMRTMFHYGAMGVTAPRQRFATMRRALTTRMLQQKTMTGLLTIDPTLAEFAARQTGAGYRKIRYVPDPAPEPGAPIGKSEARRRLGLPQEAKLVLLYGEISERKGIFSLVRGAGDPACSSQVHLLLAGRNWHLKELANEPAWQALQAQQRVHMLDGYIEAEQEALLLQAADCMWVGYIDFYGVSSVMALAGRNAMPVLASDNGVIGYLARKHQLGALVQPRDTPSIVRALNLLVNEPDTFRSAGGNGVSVYQSHGPEVLQRMVVDLVRQSWPSQPLGARQEMRA
jgi:glycosyltransferase involved in cell wall biosynthesis